MGWDVCVWGGGGGGGWGRGGVTSRKRRIPFGDEMSKVSFWVLLFTNSAINFRSGVVTSGVSYHVSQIRNIRGKCSGYIQSNVRLKVLLVSIAVANPLKSLKIPIISFLAASLLRSDADAAASIRREFCYPRNSAQKDK